MSEYKLMSGYVAVRLMKVYETTLALPGGSEGAYYKNRGTVEGVSTYDDLLVKPGDKVVFKTMNAGAEPVSPFASIEDDLVIVSVDDIIAVLS